MVSILSPHKAQWWNKDTLPSFFVLVVLTVGLLLLGADKQEASLVVTVCTLTASLSAFLFSKKCRVYTITLVALSLWVVFFSLSYFKGLVWGHEDEYLMLLSSIAIFSIGLYAASDKYRLQSTWVMLVVWFGVISIFSFFQHTVWPDLVLGLQKPYHKRRLTAFFLSSNNAATFIGIGMIIITSYLYRTYRVLSSNSIYRSRWAWFTFLQKSSPIIIALIFSYTCLLLTASRAGNAAIMLAMTVFSMGVFLRRRRFLEKGRSGEFLLLILSSMFTLLAIFLFWSLSGESLSLRYDTLNIDLSARINMADVMWAAYEQSPITGHGLGSIKEVKTIGTTAENSESVMAQNAAHNFFLQWLVQVGWLGTSVMTLFLIYIIYTIFRGFLYARGFGTYLCAILSIVVLVLVHGLFDYALEIPVVMLTFSFILGIGYGVSKKFGKLNAVL